MNHGSRLNPQDARFQDQFLAQMFDFKIRCVKVIVLLK